MSNSALFKHIPNVDSLLEDPYIARWRGRLSRKFLAGVVREALDSVRSSIDTGVIDSRAQIQQSIYDAVDVICKRLVIPSLRRAINATGIILHTGLGRASLSEEAWGAIAEVAQHAAVLELSRLSGERSHRIDHIMELLQKLTGGESAAVVNNNAAAVLLMLDTVAHGREVLVSRGQLVEIGGQFRIPDVISKSGARMVEVGTTNKTHLSDYEKGITPDTAAILVVHPSNFRIEGFVSQVPVEQLSGLAHERGITLLYDLGGGVLVDLESMGLPHEPVVRDALEQGADLVSFSGDKIMGGPQSGIIVGKEALVSQLHSNPLMRALRCDKLTYAALEATLLIYLQDDVAAQIPTLRQMTEPADQVNKRAQMVVDLLAECEPVPVVMASRAQIGSGAMPTETLESFAVVLGIPGISPNRVARRLRLCEPPVFGYVKNDMVWLDMRTVKDGELTLLARACRWACDDPEGDGILGLGEEEEVSVADDSG